MWGQLKTLSHLQATSMVVEKRLKDDLCCHGLYIANNDDNVEKTKEIEKLKGPWALGWQLLTNESNKKNCKHKLDGENEVQHSSVVSRWTRKEQLCLFL